MPEITIDGRRITAPDGATILEAAELADIRIPTLCHLPGRPPQTSCFLCVVRVEGVSRLLPSCATRVTEGMVVANETDDVRAARRTAIELLLSDHLGDCVGPCQGVCPAHMDIPRMMALTAEGRFREALIVVKEAIPLPAILGRICPELCEKGCRRAAHDGALSVCLTKRFVADTDLASEDPYLPACAPDSGRRVAIIGSGPAGLSAAYYLRTLGHACTIFDDREAPGGMLRYGVPRDELPERVLDDEIGAITRLGVALQMRRRIGGDVSLAELRDGHDAVLIAAGDVRGDRDAWRDLDFGPQGLKVERSSMATGMARVFAAGGALLPLKHAVRAVADGRAAAYAIDEFLTGSRAGSTDPGFSVHIGKLDERSIRPFLRFGGASGRQQPSSEGDAGFTPEQARREASRCLKCACSAAPTCRLRALAAAYDAQPLHFSGDRRGFGMDDSHPDVVFEPGKCIACGICVRIAAEAREELGLGFVGRAFQVRAAVPFSSAMVDGLREVALACADACPTGALMRRR